MNPREFIAALGGAAAWPLGGDAQQPERRRRMGMPGDDGSVQAQLQDVGYIEAKNLKLDVGLAEQDYARLPALAGEHVSLRPRDLGSFHRATDAVRRATSSIRIVMVSVADRIRSGSVKSLARHGGNIKGLSNQSHDRSAKTLEVRHAAVPNAKRIEVVMSPTSSHQTIIQEAYTAAGMLELMESFP